MPFVANFLLYQKHRGHF